MFKIIEPLREPELFAFLSLFDPTKITQLHLDLYNGTDSGHTELPNGVHVEHTRISLYVPSVEGLKTALDSVEHNQVQKCRVSLYGFTESITLDLISLKMTASGPFEMSEVEKMITFCQENRIKDLHIQF